MRARLALAVVAVLALVPARPAAPIEGSFTAELTRRQLEVLLAEVANGDRIGTPRSSYRVVEFAPDPASDTYMCGALTDQTVRVISRVTPPEQLSVRCVDVVPPGPLPDSPELLWNGLRDRIGIDAPFAVSPAKGLAGIRTRLAYTGATIATVRVDGVAHYAIGLANLVRLCWYDGDIRLACIDGNDASATTDVVFRTRGTRALRLDATWRGVAALYRQGDPVPLRVRSLGEVVLSTTISYPVASAEAVID